MNKYQALKLRHLMYDVSGFPYKTNNPVMRGFIQTIRKLDEANRIEVVHLVDNISVEVTLVKGLTLEIVFYDHNTDENLHVEKEFMTFENGAFTDD